MWADLKMNHASTLRTRSEVIISVLGVAAIAVMLWTFTSVASGQVHKAQLREAARQSQSVETVRCWQDSAGPQAMSSCLSDVQVQAAQALDRSYGRTQQPVARNAIQDTPVAMSGGLSTVSMRY